LGGGEVAIQHLTAALLQFSCFSDGVSDRISYIVCRGFSGALWDIAIQQFCWVQRGYPNVQIDPIEQRT
jgi:hypothetical protein